VIPQNEDDDDSRSRCTEHELDPISPQKNPDDSDCSIGNTDSYTKTLNEDQHASIDIDIDSDAEMDSDAQTDDNLKHAKVEACFRSIDGRAYNAHLSWVYPSAEDDQKGTYDPCYKHLCNYCVQYSSMLNFPCFCILEVAKHASKNDVRFPSHHVTTIANGFLPAELYPRCFRAKNNHKLIQEVEKKLFLTIPTQDCLDKYTTPTPHLKAAPQYKAVVENGYRQPSKGESGFSLSSSRKLNKKGAPSKQRGRYACKETSLVQVNIPNKKFVTAFEKAVSSSEQHDGHDGCIFLTEDQCEVIEETTDPQTPIKLRACSHCDQPGHYRNKCSVMYTASKTIVKPNMIETGSYLVYRVPTNKYKDVPEEILPLSSSNLNRSIFRSYNREGRDSELTKNNKKIQTNVDNNTDPEMNMKSLREKFRRNFKDKSEETTAFY